MAFLCTLYLLASEYVPAKKTKGEILVFRRGKLTKYSTEGDEEAQSSSGQGSSGRRAMYRVSSEKVNADPKSSTNFETHAATFLWDELNYDVPVKKGSRRLLADVEGWIKPGTLTALMVWHHTPELPKSNKLTILEGSFGSRQDDVVERTCESCLNRDCRR